MNIIRLQNLITIIEVKCNSLKKVKVNLFFNVRQKKDLGLEVFGGK